jgi:hypothetical protein
VWGGSAIWEPRALATREAGGGHPRGASRHAEREAGKREREAGKRESLPAVEGMGLLLG